MIGGNSCDCSLPSSCDFCKSSVAIAASALAVDAVLFGSSVVSIHYDWYQWSIQKQINWLINLHFADAKRFCVTQLSMAMRWFSTATEHYATFVISVTFSKQTAVMLCSVCVCVIKYAILNAHINRWTVAKHKNSTAFGN